jgi:hypothetical protein
METASQHLDQQHATPDLCHDLTLIGAHMESMLLHDINMISPGDRTFTAEELTDFLAKLPRAEQASSSWSHLQINIQP